MRPVSRLALLFAVAALVGCASSMNVASDVSVPPQSSITARITAERLVVKNVGGVPVTLAPAHRVERAELAPQASWRRRLDGSLDLVVSNPSASDPALVRISLRGSVDGATQLHVERPDGGRSDVSTRER